MHIKQFLPVIFILFTRFLSATHIVGGDITYRCLGTNYFYVEFKMYRDCNPGNAQFDNQITLGLFRQDDDVWTADLQMLLGTVSPVDLTGGNICTPPTGICVEEGIFSGYYTIPDHAAGYYIEWQRCCRNATILNIVNPLSVGNTYLTHMPDPALCNSSPVFGQQLIPLMCLSQVNNMSFAAADNDNDTLIYTLTTPLEGGSQSSPIPPPTPKPYTPVTWQSPYSLSNIVGGNPPMSINPATGMMTAKPDQIGTFVLTVQLDEFRNGQKIGEVRRDIQIIVDNCGVKPTADFFFTEPGCDSTTVFFSDSSSGALYYYWIFGDGASSPQKDPVHTYSSPGTYTVTLIVMNADSCTDTISKVVSAYGSPVSDFTFSPTCVNDPVSFTDASQGNPVQWYWDFGDGVTDTAKNPVHTYSQTDSFLVLLIVTNSDGCTDTIQKMVTVSPYPVADFTAYLDITCDGITARFNNLSSYINSSLWSFGDGSTSTETSPSHQYSGSGDYTVMLIAYNKEGCPDTVQKTINVNEVIDYSVPNVITPNGDGYNECFRPWIDTKGKYLSCYAMIIFDRWGVNMHETKSPADCWKGTNRYSVPVAQGTYYYLLSIGKILLTGYIAVLYE